MAECTATPEDLPAEGISLDVEVPLATGGHGA